MTFVGAGGEPAGERELHRVGRGDREVAPVGLDAAEEADPHRVGAGAEGGVDAHRRAIDDHVARRVADGGAAPES